MKKLIILYIVCIALLTCNIILLFIYGKLKEEVSYLKMGVLANSYKAVEESVIGKNVALLNSTAEAKNVCQKKHYNMICFFADECGRCLYGETQEWKKLAEEAKELSVIAVSIDSIAWIKEQYIAQYQPNFPVFRLKDIKKDFEVKDAPFVVVTNKNGKVILAHRGLYAADKKRKKFYTLVKDLIK